MPRLLPESSMPDAYPHLSRPTRQAPSVLGTKVVSLAIAFIFIVVGQAIAAFATSYTTLYLSSLLSAVSLATIIGRAFRTTFFILLGYTFLGLLNISNWRGYISPDSLRIVSTSLLLLGFPLIGVREARRPAVLKNPGPGILRIVIASHLVVSYVALLYIYLRHGSVASNHALRFDVSTSAQYILRSTLPLAAFAPIFFNRARTQVCFVLAVIGPTILMAGRGSAVLALLSYVLSYSYLVDRQRIQLKRRTILFISGVLSTLVVYLGFVVRRSGSSELATSNTVIASYFDYDTWWVHLILPFYLGFRETLGLTNFIIETGIRTSPETGWIFLADFATLLPGTQLAAGQMLSQIVGSVERGGLTPGLIGGLFIDIGSMTPLAFLAFGIALRYAGLKAQSNVLLAPLLAVCLSQFVHLFHRGFLKPEYVTTIAISLIYVYFLVQSRIVHPAASRVKP